MRTFIENVVEGNMSARHTAPIVEVFKERFDNTFNTCQGRKNACTLGAVPLYGRCY